MKRLTLLLTFAVFLLTLGMAAAQDATSTPSFGPIITDATAEPEATTVQEATEAAAPTDAEPATPEGSDPRGVTCTAPTLPNFAPYIIRPGDRLADLLTGIDNITVTQLAVLNCLDDPAALPVGATIWLPAPAVAAPTDVEATAEVADEASVEDAATASISSFTLSVDPVPNLEGANFTWEAVGASAYFYPCPADTEIECTRPVHAEAYPLVHALTVSNFQYAGAARYRLEVVGGDERATQDISFEVACSQEWLGMITGYARCSENPPLSTFGVWQPFEGGVMLYFGDTGEIYVMTNGDNRVEVYQDTFEEGMEPTEFDDIPADRFPARRGFGIVWESLGAQDSPLGWALAEEIGFDTARQPAGRVSYTTYIQGPGEAVYAVTLVPSLGIGYWTQVAG